MNIYIKLATLALLTVFASGTVFGWSIKPSTDMSLMCMFAYCEQSHTQTENVVRTITVGGVTHTDWNGSCVDDNGTHGAFIGNDDSWTCYAFDKVTGE